MALLTERFDRAFAFVAALHREQTRKGGRLPYLSHLLAVTALVLEDGGSEDEAIAALLHDAIEDQGDTFAGGRAGLRKVIREQFGEAVLAIVNHCTDDDQHPKVPALLNAAREALGGSPVAAAWRLRKQAYLDHLPTAPREALRVSCADKVHNVRSVLRDYRACGEELWERFRTRSRDDQLWYYRELCRVFRAAGAGRLAEELCRAVDELVILCGAAK